MMPRAGIMNLSLKAQRASESKPPVTVNWQIYRLSWTRTRDKRVMRLHCHDGNRTNYRLTTTCGVVPLPVQHKQEPSSYRNPRLSCNLDARWQLTRFLILSSCYVYIFNNVKWTNIQASSFYCLKSTGFPCDALV